VVDTVDPLAGSYFVESLTEEVEAGAWRYLERIEEMGGAVAAIEAGFMQDEIERAAYDYATAVDRGEKVIVGLNRFREEADEATELLPVDPSLEARQVDRVRRTRADRDQARVESALREVRDAAGGSSNVLVPMKSALRARATLGEVSDVLREVWGVHRPNH